MPTAYSYIRFSTPDQAKGDSFRRQVEMSDAYAEKHGLEIDASLRMTDLGKSAFTGKNLTEGALGAFVKEVEDGKVERGSYLLVESLDRLSRAVVPKALRLFLALVEAGITIVTLADERAYSEESLSNDMTDIIISIVIMSRAYEESQRKADRLSRSWAQKRKLIGERALTGTCPAWLKKREDWSGFDIVEERAVIVREIFQLVHDGVGHTGVTDRLNTRKEPTWTRGKKKAQGWHSSYVAKIIENRAVIGHFQPHRMENGKRVPAGDEVKNYFPALIPEPMFLSVQNRKPRPAGKCANSVSNLFTRLAFDGYHPEARMHFGDKGTSKTGKGRWTYLVSDHRRIDPTSRKIFWRYDHFETAFLRFVEGFDWGVLAGQQRSDELTKVEGEILVLESRVEESIAQIEKLVDAVALTSDPPQALLARIKSMDLEKSIQETALKQLKQKGRRLQSQEQSLNENIDDLRKLAVNAMEQTAFEPRLRLREELRRKIERIELFPFGWPNVVQTGSDPETGEPWLKLQPPDLPSSPAQLKKLGSLRKSGFWVKFANGSSTFVTCSTPSSAINTPEMNQALTATVMEFLPSGGGKNPLQAMAEFQTSES